MLFRLLSAPRVTAPRLLLVTATALLGGLIPASAQAATRTFSNSYAQTLHGDIAAIGNTNSTCATTWATCDTTTLTSSNSNQGYGKLVDIDGVAATPNSSASTLNLPAGAVVQSARLVWGTAGDGTDNATDKTVKFDTPATAGYAYTDIVAPAAQCGNGASGTNRGTSCAADVTSLVAAGGNGGYTIANIEQRAAAATAPDHWSGWGLYVAYKLATEPLRRLVLADGFQVVANGAPATVTASGFVAPASGAVTAQLTYMVGEGDADIKGDNATFGSKTLDPTTPVANANLMDSEIRGLTYAGARNPSFTNNYGFDIHQDEVNGAIANAATSANFSFTSTADVYYPMALGIAIDLGEPNLVLTKTLSDVNGGVVEPGDILEYQIVAQNTGNDGAAQVTMTDPIPAGTTYVPGSMQVTAGANAGAKTDATGDDQADFASNQVTMRLGTGANATAGGVLAAGGGTTTVKFRVRINDNDDEGVPLVNTASGSYVGQTSLLAYADPSSVAATPVRRADMVVAQTLSANMTAGQAGTVTLTASNIGGATTLGKPVTVTETLPSSVTFGAITGAPGWTCDTASLPTITCTRTDTLAAASAYPDIVIAVTPSQTATSATFGTTVAGGNEVNTANDTDSDAVTFQRSANLSLTKTVDAATSRVGDTLTYTLIAKNTGPSDTTGVAVTDSLPAGLMLVSSTSTQGPCSASGQTVTCAVGALTSGATATITIKATILPAGAASTIVNGASIAGNDPDPTPGNNSGAASTSVGQTTDLHVTSSVSPTSVNPGATATWTITVLNEGAGPATAAQLTNTVPAGFTVASITPSTGTCTAGSPFTCSLGTLAAGASATITLVGTPTLAAAGTTLTDSATSSTTASDSDPSDNTASSGLTVNPAADLSVVKTVDKTTANIGDILSYTITATNNGPSAATGVVFGDDFPSGVVMQTIVGPSGSTCATNSAGANCSLSGPLASGSSIVLTITVKVLSSGAGAAQSNRGRASADTFDPNTANNTSIVTTNVNRAADVHVTKSASKLTANIGDTITWTVQAINEGPSTATGVVVTDTLPAGVTLITPLPAGCSVLGAQVVCTLASLASGANTPFVLQGTVDRAAAESPLQNVAQITANEYDPVTTNNSTSVTTTVNKATDLKIAKSVDKSSASVGDALTYTLTATNDGPSTATGVQVTDTLPAGFSPTGIPTIAGGTCSYSGQTLTCTLATLASAGTRTITIPGTVTSAASNTSMSNTAAITGNEFDQDLTNNTSAPATTSVGQQAELALTKSVDKLSGNVGDTLTYTLKVTNSGPQPATAATITDPLPSTVIWASTVQSQGSCNVGAPVVCNVGTIGVGSSATVTITATVKTAAAGTTVTNSATVSAAQSDLNPADNSASASTSIAGAADLQITKTADKSAANVGDAINWTLAAKNNGPSAATGVSITDSIPAGVTLLAFTGLPSGVSCTATGTTVVCAIAGSIANGASVAIPLSATVNRSAAETPLQNSATIGGNQTDPDTSNNLSQVTTTVNKAADLRVTKVANKGAANVGDTITWTLAVTNDGPSVASNVILTDDLPAGTSLQTSSITGGGSCAVSGPQLVCTAGTLASGQSATATITSKVQRANAESPVNNTGHATSDQFDPDTANNTATTATTVGPSTDLRIGKTVDKASANVGDTVTYTLTATNDGPSTATGVQITDALPAGLTRTGTVTASQGSCNPAGLALTCSVGSLSNAATATYTVKAIVGSTNAGTTISNTAAVAGNESDPASANNTSPATTTAVAVAADVAVLATVDKATANVGDTLTYTFKATNNGPSTATGTQLVATLPAGLSIVSSGAPGLACTGTTTITCAGSLPSGSSATLTVVATVASAASGTTLTAPSTITATPFDPVSGNNASSAATIVAPAADLRATKTVDKTTANVGDAVTYTLTATNAGPAPATGVKLTDAIPASLQIIGTPTASQGTCTVAGQVVTCTVGALASGASATATIVTKVLASAATTTVSNTAKVTGNEFDPVPSNDTSPATNTSVGAVADVAVVTTVDKATANVGDTLTYTFVATNNGPQTAAGFQLDATLLPGLQVLTATAPGLSCAIGTPVVCSGTLASGASATLTVTATVLSGASNSILTTLGSVSATPFDPVSSNDTSSAATTVAPAADVSITKTVDKATANVGDTILYTLKAANAGPAPATGVTITDTVPSALQITGTPAPSQGTCSVTGQAVSCAAGTVASGASATVTFTAKVLAAAATTTISNVGKAGANEFDPATTNNTSVPATTNVPGSADVAVVTSVDKATANVGDTLTYTFAVTNAGPQSASGLSLTAGIPPGLTALTTTAPGLTCSGSPITCTGSLASGASTTVTVSAKVQSSASATTQTATGTVSATPFDPVAANNTSTAATTIAPAADLSASKTVDQATANIGDTLTYTLKASNAGPAAATGAKLVDTVPATLQIIGTPTASQGTCALAGQVVTCAIGTVASGASATATILVKVLAAGAGSTISNTVKASGNEFDTTAANNTSPPATTSINPVADVAVVTAVDKPTASVGDTLTYTFAATNNGPQTASGFQLQGTLPAGMQVLTASAPGLSCNSASPVVCTGSLANGASTTLTVTAKVLTAASGTTATATGVVSATPLDPASANNTSSASTTIAPAADLAITKTVDKTTANIGDTLTYTLKATSGGPASATGVTITDTVPSTLQIMGTPTLSPSGTCAVSGQIVTCAAGTLAAGNTATATILAKVLPSAASSTVANIGSVTGNETDPAPANNTSPATSTAVGLAADVAVLTAVDQPTANVGDTLTYTFKATNNGPQAATGFSLTGTLPTGLQLLTGAAPGLACSGNPVVCTGTLANGASTTLTVTAKVLSAASGTTATATGAVSAAPTDSVPANNTSSASTTVAPATDLTMTKTVDKATANIGDTLTYTLKADNLGPASATGVRILDTLPSTLQLVGSPTASQGACSISGQTVTCLVGSVANGASATVTILAKVLPAAAAATIANTATIDGNQFDPTPANDSSAPASTAVSSAADLQVTQTTSSPTVNVGDTVDYIVTVKNSGPQGATGVSLSDDLPAGATLVSATPAQGTCGTGDPFACTLGSLASGASTTITVKVKIVGAAESTFANVASAAATQFDVDTSNNSATAAVSTNPATDLKITKTADKSAANVGDTITWTLTTTNSGPSGATGITITDTVPAGVTLQPISGLPTAVTCSISGQVVSCAKAGSLASGAGLLITLKGTVKTSAAGTPQSNSATVAGNEFDPDTSNNLSAVTTNVSGAADLSITKGVDKATANVGDTLNWTVVATNNGPSTATGVVVTDDLPTGVTLLSNAPTAGTCAVSGTQLVCTGSTLASGASMTVTLSGKVKTSAAESPVSNVARVTSSVFDPDTANNLSTATTTVGPAADLKITKSVDKATANVGDTLTYTLTTISAGPSSATGAALTDTLPSGLQVSGTPTSTQGACAVTGQTVTCSIGTLPSGSSATTIIKAIVKASASSSSVANTASVTGSRLDPDPSNNTSSPTMTAISAAADLVVANTVDQTSLNLGDTATFTITVKNNGPSSATGVSLTSALPAGTTLLSRSTSQGTCTSADPVVCSLGTIAPGATATITIKVSIDTGASATFTDKATATATEFEPTPADNTASAATSTGPAADLSLTKVADKASANVGDTITWTLVAKNAGPSPASGVTVTDAIPAGVTAVTASGTNGVTCVIASGTVSCPIPGPWAASSPRTITLTGKVATSNAGSPLSNQASIAGAEFDPNPADNLSTATTDVNDAADLDITKTVDKGTASVGDTITWTVAAINHGPSAASGTLIVDDFPAGVTFLSATSTQGLCALVGAQVSCDVNGLASGQTATATIKGRVETANAESPVVNAARVTSSTFDPDTANNLSTVSTAVGKSIDLTTSAAANKATANIGDDVMYTFTVGNAGPSTATGVQFTHAIPAGTSFVSATSTTGGCIASAGTLTCAVGTVSSGGSDTIIVHVKVGAAAAGTTITAKGSGAATEPDRDPSNNTSPVVTTAVAEAADLAVATTVDQGSAPVGSTLTYLVSVTNQGPSTATGVQLTNQIPAGARVVSVTPSQGSCNIGNPRLCALGTLAPNATATLTVVVKSTPSSAASSLTDQASATADQFDPVTSNNAASASSAVGTAADLQVTGTVDKAAAQVGDTVTWTIMAKNNGPNDASGVAVTDVVPAGVTITSATSTAGTCTTGAPISCAVGNLANGASATITVTGRLARAAAGQPLATQATIIGNELDPDLTNNVSPAQTTIVGPAADLRLTKIIDKANPAIGDSVNWTIQLFNDGPSAASSAQITDAVPAGAAITSATGNSGAVTCATAAQTVTCTVASIPSGGSVTVTIKATVSATAGGSVLDNAATASSATLDPDPSNNTATARATAGAAADLSIALAPDRPTATVGEAITWTAVLGNGGPQTATGVVTTLTIPAGLENVAASVPGGACVVSGVTVTCTIPDLLAGATANVTITGTAGRDTAEQSLVASGTVAGALPDPITNNNTASAAIVAIPAAVDLVVTKTADKENAVAGDQITITTTVLNRGPSAATDVVLTDTVPDGVTLNSATSSQGSCAVAGNTITCRLGSIPNGGTATIAAVYTVNTTGSDQQLLNAGSATSPQFDSDGSNNAAQIAATGKPATGKPAAARPVTIKNLTPALELTKTVDKGSAVVGSQVVFTLTATNHGSAPASGVRVTDQLPAGLAYVSTKAFGMTCTRQALTITCVASSLAPGKSVSAKITTDLALAGVPIDNVATITAAGLTDIGVKGQRASAQVVGSGAPYVVAGIKSLEDYSRPGKRMRIAVKVTNVGQAQARGASACFTLPTSVVLMKKPAGLVQHGGQFCLTAPSLQPGKYKRVVLATRVVGGAGRTRPKLIGKATNSRVKVETYPLVIRGLRPTKAAGVTG